MSITSNSKKAHSRAGKHEKNSKASQQSGFIMFSINFNLKKSYVFSHDLINNQVSRLTLVRTIVHGWTIKSIQLLPVALLVSCHLIKFVRQIKPVFNKKNIYIKKSTLQPANINNFFPLNNPFNIHQKSNQKSIFFS